MNKPFVSVIIAAYMAEDTLLTAVNSLKAQSFNDWEAIIVDDHSSDNTYDLALSISSSDPRFKVIRLAQNSGPSAARNQGIRLSAGDWITVLDSDDAFLPCRLANFVKFVDQNDFGMVFDNLADLSAPLSLSKAYWPEWVSLANEISLLEMLKGCASLFDNHYGLLKPFVSRSEIESKNLFYDEELRRGEDVNFCFRLMLNGVRAGRIAEVGYLYDKPSPSNTTNASRKNLIHSYLGTKKIKDEYWYKLLPSERRWLRIRLAQTLVCDDLNTFWTAKHNRNFGTIMKLLLRSWSVRELIFHGILPFKMYRMVDRFSKLRLMK